MPRRLITELPPQAQVDQTFLATHKQLRPNRNGQLYLQVELADKSGMITGRLWNASDDDFNAFEDGDYVRVEGHTQLYSGSLQLIVSAIDRSHAYVLPTLVGAALLAAALFSAPWLTLIALGLVYLSMFPFSYRSFRRLTAEAQRIAGVAPPEETPPAA